MFCVDPREQDGQDGTPQTVWGGPSSLVELRSQFFRYRFQNAFPNSLRSGGFSGDQQMPTVQEATPSHHRNLRV